MLTDAMYEIERNGSAKVFVASTAESRKICNDPFTLGLEYTDLLSHACQKVLLELGEIFSEKTTRVLHVLRGGLNFGLREALGRAYGWNLHSSLFVSAQRARKKPGTNDWHITESDYKKLHLGAVNEILFGDVVATGTSLEHALNEIGRIAAGTGAEIHSICFFTIGGKRAAEIIEKLHEDPVWKEIGLRSSSVIYLEGIFEVASPQSQMQIQIEGTDLLRKESWLAPEFIESQYESPSYPIERCTIYDAGSRAFDSAVYLEEIHSYWEQVVEKARQGLSYENYLQERFPQLDPSRFGNISLLDVAQSQVEKSQELLARVLS